MLFIDDYMVWFCQHPERLQHSLNLRNIQQRRKQQQL